MSANNPFQTPSQQAGEMKHIRIAKGFRYVKDPSAGDLLFQGVVIAGVEGLYVSHDSHQWQSTGTAMAMFGLIGLAVNKFLTRNKTFEYPFATMPAANLPDAIQSRMSEHKFKKKSIVSVIPRSEITGFHSSLGNKKIVLVDRELMLLSPIRKGMKQLEELGYPKLNA